MKIYFSYLFHTDYSLLMINITCHVDHKNHSWACFSVHYDFVQNNSLKSVEPNYKLKNNNKCRGYIYI